MILVVLGLDAERVVRDVDGRDVPGDDAGTEALGLRAHLVHQVRPHDAVPVARPVVDHRRDHELTASLEAFDHERMQVRPGRVQRGGQARRARPDDDNRQRIDVHRCFSMSEDNWSRVTCAPTT